MRKILTVVFAMIFTNIAVAQQLPAGSVGIVTNNTPNTWQTFTYTFTPSQTGANFVGFAFRQDPEYWTFDNVKITAAGSSTNLLTNGAFDTGGNFSVNVSNRTVTLQAPTNWGVWYQTRADGGIPGAAGTWQDNGAPHGGVWYDGAVGSFDGIYQGVNLTAGTAYTISFDVNGDDTSDGNMIQLGVYGGACANVSIAPAQCTIPATAGFTTLATPAQGAAAGGPPAPTTFSSVATGNTVTTDTMDTGTFTGAGGTLQIVSGQTTVTNPITLNPGMTVDTNGQAGTLSGVISGNGGLTVTGTSGSLTLTAVNTYTGPTTVNSGATLNNSGTIASASVINNNGTFNNSGTAGTLNNRGTATNTGVLNSITNYVNSLFTNSGTTGAITNAGTVNTTGRTGAITNTGTVNIGGARVVVLSTGSNYLGMTTDTIQAQIDSTVQAIRSRIPDAKIVMVLPYRNMSAYQGVINGQNVYGGGQTTTIPNDAASAVAAKYGIPTVSFATSTDNIHPSNYPAVISQIRTLTSVPSSQWYYVGDSITLALAGSGGGATTYAQNSRSPQYILDNFVPLLPTTTAVQVGAITNSRTVNLLGPATLGAVTNSGTFNASGSGGHVALPTFTQTAAGNLILANGQQLNVTGAATLNGTLTINNSTTAFGRYAVVNAGSVSGTFTTLTLNPDISPLGSYLKYASNSVRLYITPGKSATEQGIAAIRNDSSSMNAIVSGRTTGVLDSQCSGPNGCVSVNVGTSKSGTGNLTSGGVTISNNVSENARIGIFLDRAFTNPSTNTVHYKPSNPVMGGYVGLDYEKINLTLSAAMGSGTYRYNRPLVDYAETGSGSSKVDSKAYQARVSYAIPLFYDITVSPYIGVRYSLLGVAAFTETGPVFPLSINSYKQKSTDAIAGLGFNKKLTDELSVNTSIGVTKNIKTDTGSISGTSEISGLDTFNAGLERGKNLSWGVGAGVSYQFIPNHTVGVNVGFEQKSLVNPRAGSLGLSYTYGF